MDELKNEQVKTPAANGGTVSSTNQQYINQMYDKQLEGQRAGLENAYNQSLAAAEQNQKQISQNYQAGANDLAAQYERNRANFNQAALRNGINTGAYSQAELARQSQYQRDFGSLRAQEAMAQAQAGMQVTNLKSDYQTKIQQAIAENDYNRAAAMYKEFNEAQQRQQQNAATMGSAGDFSGYVQMYLNQGYSLEEAQRMADTLQGYWNSKNPDSALLAGRITMDEYNRIKNPTGGGGYGGYAPPKEETKDDTASEEFAKWSNDLQRAGILANNPNAGWDQIVAYNDLVAQGAAKGYITPEQAKAGFYKGGVNDTVVAAPTTSSTSSGTTTAPKTTATTSTAAKSRADSLSEADKSEMELFGFTR